VSCSYWLIPIHVDLASRPLDLKVTGTVGIDPHPIGLSGCFEPPDHDPTDGMKRKERNSPN
jgi:hypothetical protein